MIKPSYQEFNLNIGWFIDAMSVRGFTIDEMKCVSFVVPYHDPDTRLVRGGLRYLSDICRSLEYAYNFMIADEEMADSRVDLVCLHYEHALDLLKKELPKIRQIEKSTKRLLGEPKLTRNFENETLRNYDLSYLIQTA